MQYIPTSVAETTAPIMVLLTLPAAAAAFRAFQQQFYREMQILVGGLAALCTLLIGADLVRVIALASPTGVDHSLGGLDLEGWIAWRLVLPLAVTAVMLSFQEIGKAMKPHEMGAKSSPDEYSEHERWAFSVVFSAKRDV